MKNSCMAVTGLAILVATAATAGEAHASAFGFDFSGPGVSGALTLTYGTAADAKYPNAYEVTGISGVFSDSNNGLDIVTAHPPSPPKERSPSMR